jgi:hypothetical protein
MNYSARRLSVRVPTEEWEADIPTERTVHTTAQIINISADGAYLVVQRPFQLDSIMTMYIKFQRLSFHTEAKVIHAEPNGIGVRFLDLDRAIRASILTQITEHLNLRYLKR